MGDSRIDYSKREIIYWGIIRKQAHERAHHKVTGVELKLKRKSSLGRNIQDKIIMMKVCGQTKREK